MAQVLRAIAAVLEKIEHENDHGLTMVSPMDMSVTQFKAKCLGVIEKVQRDKTRVTITRHGRPAAELVPVANSAPGALFGRSRETTVILGDLTGMGEHWHAED